ncbi:MAG: hypothetical protein JO232_13885 [Verrucomicrobia bacterium]|nr:hypothetical protein [Verrucomicrobiota bacterium]
MTIELITTGVADSKRSAPEPELLIILIVLLALLCALIALAAYYLAHHPELWNAILSNAITHPTT